MNKENKEIVCEARFVFDSSKELFDIIPFLILKGYTVTIKQDDYFKVICFIEKDNNSDGGI